MHAVGWGFSSENGRTLDAYLETYIYNCRLLAVFDRRNDNPRTTNYLLKAYIPINRTGSPQGFSQVQILHKSYNTLCKYKTCKHYPITSPFGITLIKKKGK